MAGARAAAGARAIGWNSSDVPIAASAGREITAKLGAMLNWLWKLFDRTARSPDYLIVPESGVQVSHDERSVRMTRPDTAELEVVWSDLVRVTILTTGAGPFMTDLFWVLSAREGSHDIVVPLGAKGEHELLKAMQRRLAGFDNLAVIEAIGSTDNASFVVWEAGAKD